MVDAAVIWHVSDTSCATCHVHAWLASAVVVIVHDGVHVVRCMVVVEVVEEMPINAKG